MELFRLINSVCYKSNINLRYVKKSFKNEELTYYIVSLEICSSLQSQSYYKIKQGQWINHLKLEQPLLRNVSTEQKYMRLLFNSIKMIYKYE
ncbi:unnamed protein product [Paramecium octaurelia]|uniref:Uncharacterized protein n=1 Tax=Paramecium octaurelia TaxID=43137 RepID=A0A8S1X2X6_PAROT|nr:unnamed protein product [Paramecium octaurelia]